MDEPAEDAEAPAADRTPRGWAAKLTSLVVNLGLAAVTLLVLVVVLEVTLRLSGFQYVLYPEDIEFGRPDPVMLKVGFQPDDDLFWVTRDYQEKLDRLENEKPPLLLLGDSCTHLARWDQALVHLADRRHSARLRFGNLAVAGWSSYQGLRQVERDVLDLEPSVVTLYYGWNDHWIGFGIEDRNVAHVRRVFSSRFSSLRLVQLGTKGMVAWGARQTAYPNRVSEADFESNLRSMIHQLRERGIVPVVITAASNHRQGEEPPELTERWLRDLDDLVPLHQRYVEIARRVGRDSSMPHKGSAAEGPVLCDLAERFAALDPAERDRYFRADGIHTSAEGDRRLAAFVDQCFEENGLWQLILE